MTSRAPNRAILGSVVDDEGAQPAARPEIHGAEPPPPPDQGDGAGTLAPPSSAPPPRFETWWTIVASILLVALAVLVVAGKRGAGLQTTGIDPLKAFDRMVQREASEPPLSRAVAADAERTLKVLIVDGKQPTVVANGARARLVIVLGESGRWAEAQPYLLWSDHASLIPVVTCAYGSGDETCATPSACDDAHLAALETLAGPWAARRACKAAAHRRGDAATGAKLSEGPAEYARRMVWPDLQFVLSAVLALAGIVAGGILVRAWRGSPAPPPAPPPAPWTVAELYAALVRCAALPLLCGIVIAIVLVALKLPYDPTVGIALYLFGWGWVARLVFKRFGLSWTDALFAGRGERGAKTGVVVLFTMAAIGLDRVGHFAIRYAGGGLGLRSPWSDQFPPETAQFSMRLIGVILEIVILAPLVEELVCRRVIFAAFRQRWRFGFAALASAVIFAAPHAYSAVGMLALLWTGLVTAWAYDRTANLWPGLLVHAANNALAVLFSLT